MFIFFYLVNPSHFRTFLGRYRWRLHVFFWRSYGLWFQTLRDSLRNPQHGVQDKHQRFTQKVVQSWSISTYQRQALWSLVIFVKTGYKKKDISAIKNTFAINGFFSHSFSLRLPICNVLSNNLAVCRILIGVVRMFAGGCPSKHSVDHSEIKPFQYPSPLKESVGL